MKTLIIDKNPLKINVDDIRNIKILETIKNGNTLYKKIQKSFKEKHNKYLLL